MHINTAFVPLMVSLSSYATVSNGFSVAMRPLLELRQMKKGNVLVERGKRQRVVWFLHSGTDKEMTPSREIGDRVSWFGFSSDFIFSHAGFVAQEPGGCKYRACRR